MSLRVKLLKWLVIPLLAVNLAGAAAAYWLAWIPAQGALDQSLADAAWALVPHVQETDSEIELRLSQQAEQVLRVDHFDEVFFVVRDLNGRTIAGDKDFPILQIPDKLNTSLPYTDMMRGEDVRVIALKTVVAGQVILIGAGETRIKRSQIQLRIFLTLLISEIFLAILIPLMIWLALNKGLSPLREMQGNLEQRKSDDLSTLPVSNAPVEVKPFILAINNLLTRVQDSALAKQDFLANVAHQLRTPLAGFKAQLEWLQAQHKEDPDTARSVDMMLASTDRMTRKAIQLLALARSQPGDGNRSAMELLSLDKLLAESVQQFVQEALKKNIDIGFDLQPTTVLGDRFLLRDLIDNVVDNAIRYSPDGGTVTVSCMMKEGGGVLKVEDDGPGIPETDKEQIFSRFYRLDHSQSGSGLGLAIVRDIAHEHGATISVRSGANSRGSSFLVLFPDPPQLAPV